MAVKIARVRISRRHMLGISAAFAARPAISSEVPIVFAAASLKLALDEISAQGLPLRLSYGGSGALARQILQGAPADLFLSAHPDWMKAIADANLAKGPVIDLLSNELVLIGPLGHDPVRLPDWKPEGRIAMGFVNAVPSGQYGKAAFESLGLWQSVQAQVVEVENVRAALTLVARGELPYAVVYASDTIDQGGISVIYRFPPSSHPKIVYPMAAISPAGRAAFDAVRSNDARRIFERAGFEVL
ncbi:MAG: molybdate ABC transporter substrate-binding protein [Pseudomonadota bacterium]